MQGFESMVGLLKAKEIPAAAAARVAIARWIGFYQQGDTASAVEEVQWSYYSVSATPAIAVTAPLAVVNESAVVKASAVVTPLSASAATIELGLSTALAIAKPASAVTARTIDSDEMFDHELDLLIGPAKHLGASTASEEKRRRLEMLAPKLGIEDIKDFDVAPSGDADIEKAPPVPPAPEPPVPPAPCNDDDIEKAVEVGKRLGRLEMREEILGKPFLQVPATRIANSGGSIKEKQVEDLGKAPKPKVYSGGILKRKQVEAFSGIHKDLVNREDAVLRDLERKDRLLKQEYLKVARSGNAKGMGKGGKVTDTEVASTPPAPENRTEVPSSSHQNRQLVLTGAASMANECRRVTKTRSELEDKFSKMPWSGNPSL
jgi:hypothetical protein